MEESSSGTSSCQIPTRVPSALGLARHWVLRRGKKPCDLHGNAKGWQLPAFWITFQEAAEVLNKNGQGFSGLGFVIAREPARGSKQIIGLDLDACRDPVTGWVSPWAVARLELLSSYSEVTPSLTGFHVWILGKLPEGIDSAFSEGQNPDELPPETWERIKTLKPTAEKCNSLEIYEDGPRHFTFTGQTLEQYPGELMYRRDELLQLLDECIKPEPKAEQPSGEGIDAEWYRQMRETTKGHGLPKLDILRVIDTSGWECSGDQLLGPHPLLGSSSGRNVVVHPEKGVYAYMHNGLKKGGDAWTWLACECGAIRWEDAGAGALRDPEVLQKTKEYAVQRGFFSREQLFRATIPNAVKSEGKITIDEEPLTEGGNASRLIKLYGDDIKYCHTSKKWLIWDGSRWRIDSDGKILRLAEDIVRYLYQMASSAESPNARRALATFAKTSDRNFHQKNVLEIAKNRDGIAITSEQLNRDPWLLGTPKGVMDLKALTIKEPDRKDLITRSIGATHDPSAKCDLWLAFLDKIFRGDRELIGYIQRAVGYCLSGSMVEQVFFFCHGRGQNGKSVFLGVLRALFGDYAYQADFTSFLVQRSDKVRNDLAALVGMRLIIASEAEEGSKLSMQIIKTWNGGEPITARFLHAEFFTFRPEGKIWLAANTKPTISERNFAAWRRVRLIPFSVTIPKADQDKEQEKKLLQELPGILQWALIGLKDYLDIGLEPPEAVKIATEAYRRENDSLEAFISECCQIHKLAVCRNSYLFGAYEFFCRENGHRQISQTKFSLELKAMPGISSKSSREGMVWHGIELNSDWRSNPSHDMQSLENQENVKGVNPNPDILSSIASQRDNTQTTSQPFTEGPKNVPLVASEGFEQSLNLTPIQKAKVWEEVAWMLHHEPRIEGPKIGVTLEDISKRSNQSPKDIEQLLRGNGWESSTIEVSGLKIWWATEQAKKAMGIS